MLLLASISADICLITLWSQVGGGDVLQWLLLASASVSILSMMIGAELDKKARRA
jgi:hypothetical protein